MQALRDLVEYERDKPLTDNRVAPRRS